MKTGPSEMMEIRYMPAYVDKSLLIKAIVMLFKTHILLTAPRRFGKSANTLMLIRFFEILPNETEQQVNRKLFQNLAIEKEKDIMDEHFGKHPIIYLHYKHKSSV